MDATRDAQAKETALERRHDLLSVVFTGRHGLLLLGAVHLGGVVRGGGCEWWLVAGGWWLGGGERWLVGDGWSVVSGV